MKKIYLGLILLVSFLISACNLDNDDLSITVKKTEMAYNFEASFPQNKTKKVKEYIEKSLAYDTLFKDENSQVNGEISLPDGTKFYLKTESGFIIIDFKKEKNSYNSYKKMENLCMGIKELLQD